MRNLEKNGLVHETRLLCRGCWLKYTGRSSSHSRLSAALEAGLSDACRPIWSSVMTAGQDWPTRTWKTPHYSAKKLGDKLLCIYIRTYTCIPRFSPAQRDHVHVCMCVYVCPCVCMCVHVVVCHSLLGHGSYAVCGLIRPRLCCLWASVYHSFDFTYYAFEQFPQKNSLLCFLHLPVMILLCSLICHYSPEGTYFNEVPYNETTNGTCINGSTSWTTCLLRSLELLLVPIMLDNMPA